MNPHRLRLASALEAATLFAIGPILAIVIAYRLLDNSTRLKYSSYLFRVADSGLTGLKSVQSLPPHIAELMPTPS